jgi:hypothetical protein
MEDLKLGKFKSQITQQSFKTIEEKPDRKNVFFNTNYKYKGPSKYIVERLNSNFLDVQLSRA